MVWAEIDVSFQTQIYSCSLPEVRFDTHSLREDLHFCVTSEFTGTSGHAYYGYIDFNDGRLSAYYCQSKR